MPRERPTPSRQINLPEFTKLALPFTRKATDLVVVENWVNKVEKTFLAFEVPEASRMPLAEYQLKESANDWWTTKKANL